MNKSFVAALALATATAPLAAAAQPVPYADSGYNGGDEQIHGRITAFDGQYALTVSDDRGYVDNIELHQGTIINPTGLMLAPGMIVSINGYDAGDVFAANEIDTPYDFYAGEPSYEGHPWSFFGAGISLGFFFGSTGWWNGGYYGTPYAYDGGIRIYDARFRPAFGGGAFHGQFYVADRAHGGYYGHSSYQNQTAYSGHPGFQHQGAPNQYQGGYQNGGAPHAGYQGGAPSYSGGYHGSRYQGGGASFGYQSRGTTSGGGYQSGVLHGGYTGGGYQGGAQHGGYQGGGAPHGGYQGGGNQGGGSHGGGGQGGGGSHGGGDSHGGGEHH